MREFFTFKAETFADSADKRLDVLIQILIKSLVIVIVLYIAFFLSADPDLWGHVKFGQDTLRLGYIPVNDIYSYLTSGMKWINHVWLSELMMGAFYNWDGIYGLICLKAILVFITNLLLLSAIFGCGFGTLSGSAFFLILTDLTCGGFATMRPHLFSYLFFAVLCLLLKRSTKQVHWNGWLIPGLIILWTNIHGSYLLAMVTLSLWIVAETIQAIFDFNRRQYLLSKWLLVISCFIATLINPYGWELSAFLARTLSVPRPEIGEWQPIVIANQQGVVYLLAVAIMLSSLYVSKKEKTLSSIAIILLMTIAPLLSLRHLALFVVAITIFGAEHIRAFIDYLSDKGIRFSVYQLSKFGKTVILSTLLTTTLVVICFIGKYFGHAYVSETTTLPVAAISIIKTLKMEGNLATFFDWGEYIIWHLSPNVKVSIDGRREAVYLPNVYAQNVAFTYGVGLWDTLLEKHPTDMVLVPKNYAVFNLMKLKPEWKLVYEDKVSALFLPSKSRFLPTVNQYLSKQPPLMPLQLAFP